MAPPRRKRRGARYSKLRDKKINTLFERRAKEIAQKEDRKNIRKYIFPQQVSRTGYNWNDRLALPAPADWYELEGEQLGVAGKGLAYHILSGVGGYLEDNTASQEDGTAKGMLELRFQGVECFGIVKNNSTVPVRIDARIVWIPNVNQFTDDSVDYLLPRDTMFIKTGTGNLLNQGYNRRNLATLTATGVPVKHTTVARKVMFLPAGLVTGELTAPGPVVSSVEVFPQPVYKRFTLRKRFKGMGKKMYCRTSDVLCSNGNFYFVIWSDLKSPATISFLMASNIQLSVKQLMKDIIP